MYLHSQNKHAIAQRQVSFKYCRNLFSVILYIKCNCLQTLLKMYLFGKFWKTLKKTLTLVSDGPMTLTLLKRTPPWILFLLSYQDDYISEHLALVQSKFRFFYFFIILCIFCTVKIFHSVCNLKINTFKNKFCN